MIPQPKHKRNRYAQKYFYEPKHASIIFRKEKPSFDFNTKSINSKIILTIIENWLIIKMCIAKARATLVIMFQPNGSEIK
jgi:hypothetical protein